MTHDAELNPVYAANLAELRGDVAHGLKADGTFATVRIPALDNVLRVVDDLLQALADTRQQLDEARGRITELDQRAVTATGRQIFAQTEADEMRQRQRTSNGLARQLADRTDELNTLRAQYDDLKDLCSEHSAELAATQVRLEDADAAVTRLGDAAADLVEKAKAFRAERDEARDIARVLTPHATASTAALCRLKLGLDALPGWLTDVPQPDPGPTRHGHDAPAACGPTPNALTCACGGPINHQPDTTTNERN